MQRPRRAGINGNVGAHSTAAAAAATNSMSLPVTGYIIDQVTDARYCRSPSTRRAAACCRRRPMAATLSQDPASDGTLAGSMGDIKPTLAVDAGAGVQDDAAAKRQPS